MRKNNDIKNWKGKQPIKVLEDRLIEYKKDVLSYLGRKNSQINSVKQTKDV